MSLKFARGVELPNDAVTQTFGFLGRRGSGKSYGATKLVEEMLAASCQVVALDPIGNWYGLRLGADGKAGFQVPVFGGLHGDIPLEPGAGALIADTIIDRGISAIIDVSQFRKGQRKQFVADFAEQLYNRKKAQRVRTPLHVVFEEAQVFAPQKPQKGEERMLGAVEDIVRLGRNFGLGATLISQRPQSVNKEVLNQVECLVVLQTNGPHERKAIEEWVRYQGLNIRKMVDELPSLPVGTAYIWSPQWLNILKKAKILKKRTQDTSATPTSKGLVIGPEPKRLKPKDLAAIEAAMGDLVERAKENDPVRLKNQVRELKAAVAKLEARAPAVEHVETIVESVVPAALPKVHRLLEISLGKFREEITDSLDHFERRLGEMAQVMEKNQGTKVVATTTRVGTPVKKAPVKTPAYVKPTTIDLSNGVPEGEKLKTGAERMLAAVASLDPRPVSKRQLGTLVAMKITGGTFNTYLSQLKKRGFLHDRGDGFTVHTPGSHYLQSRGIEVSSPTTTDEMVAHWGKSLKAGARRMLDILVRDHPAPVAKLALASELEMEPSGGTFNTYIGALVSNGLAVRPSTGMVCASDELFPER